MSAISQQSDILIPSSYEGTSVNDYKNTECHDAKIKYSFADDGEEEFVSMKVLPCVVENDDRDKTLSSFYLTNFEGMEHNSFFILSSSSDELMAVRVEEPIDNKEEIELYLHSYSYKAEDTFSILKNCCFNID